jgi:hypothetical protein
VRLLRDICSRLPAADAVQALLAGLGGSGSGAISSFELLSSGAVKALRDYLQGVDLAGVPDRQERLLQRMGKFAGGWLPFGTVRLAPRCWSVGKPACVRVLLLDAVVIIGSSTALGAWHGILVLMYMGRVDVQPKAICEPSGNYELMISLSDRHAEAQLTTAYLHACHPSFVLAPSYTYNFMH